jgi:hypothetical protein
VTSEQIKFTFDAVILGVAGGMAPAIEAGQLTEEEAQAGISKVFENLAEMMQPNFAQAFVAHAEKLQAEAEKAGE